MSEHASAPHTVVIAEIGVNHNGVLQTARDLVLAASDAGADYAKFQTFSATELVTKSAPVAEYQKKASGELSQRQMLKDLELSQDDFLALQEFCASTGIGFLTTAHDFVSLDFVLGLGLDYIKVPSGDLTNLPLLQRVAKETIPVILSTGMGYFEEVSEALEVLERSGLGREMVTVLQCTTHYPAPLHEANLHAMLSMRERLSVKVGYSDHTEGVEAAIAAVALGATIIEKHLTLDRGMAGPDHLASANPEEFARMVSSLRAVEQALGSQEKSPTASEVLNRDVVRKSVVAVRPIKVGEVFSVENIGVKRPGTGLSPMRWHEILGCVADRDFDVDDVIEMP
jgi:N,N'-diacetyllegionaminate synthase